MDKQHLVPHRRSCVDRREPAVSRLRDGQRPRDRWAAACDLAGRCDPGRDGLGHGIIHEPGQSGGAAGGTKCVAGRDAESIGYRTGV